MDSIGDSVWEREGYGNDTLSKRMYIAAVSGFTVYGLIMTSIIAFFTLAWQPSIWAILGIGLVIPIIGIYIAIKSDEWPISLIGYTLLVLGLGAITGPSVAFYDTGVVVTAIMATAGVTIVMSVAGIIYPKSLEGWRGYFFGGLLALIFVRLAQVALMSLGIAESLWYIPWIEYAAAILFSLYIIYDWNRALRLPKTMDNAVDCAMAIYLDIINLFITLLRIFGHKD